MRPLPLALGTLFALTQAFAADIKVTPNEAVDVAQDGKVVARFMMSHDVSTPAKRLDNYKPYLHVFDPSGALRLTKGPGFNFTHHRGIMLGFAKITVDGKNYDEGGRAQAAIAKLAHGRAEPGAWRIELMPSEAAKEDQFLVVMFPTTTAAAPAARVTRIEAEGRVGAEIVGPRRTTRWWFVPGQLGATVEVIERHGHLPRTRAV